MSQSKSSGGLGDVVAKHYNQLEEKGMEERHKSRIIYMRNFNNWVKSMLIAEYLSRVRTSVGEDSEITVLDIGCGKGGDLLKWKKGRIKHLICADIAANSVEQCQKRYEDMVRRSSRERHSTETFTAEFITADCTKERIRDHLENPDVSVDIVSIQFSFHYCFESLPQAECMLRNASENLRIGGFFIGTTPDAYDIMRRVQASPDNTVGNSVYSIVFHETQTPVPLFGAKYDFHLEGVVDCPEFLVHFPTLERLAERFGLLLVYKRRFSNVFSDYSKHDSGRTLLMKMQGLETYPAFSGEQTSSSDDNYSHAKQWIADHDSKNPPSRRTTRIGTLSKEEWEAISLYVCFAFKKISEPTLEADDSPEPTHEADDSPEPTLEADDSPEPALEADDSPEPTLEADDSPKRMRSSLDSSEESSSEAQPSKRFRVE